MKPGDTKKTRATIAALSRVAEHDYDGKQATSSARAAYWAGYEDKVDPDHTLGPQERARKARALWQADMLRGKLAKVKGKRASRKGRRGDD